MNTFTEQDIKRVLFGALVLMGNDGKNWAKKITAKDGKFSAEGALYTSGIKLNVPSSCSDAAYLYACSLVKEFGYTSPSLAMYNDDPKTVFPNIKEVFQVGINRLK